MTAVSEPHPIDLWRARFEDSVRFSLHRSIERLVTDRCETVAGQRRQIQTALSCAKRLDASHIHGVDISTVSRYLDLVCGVVSFKEVYSLPPLSDGLLSLFHSDDQELIHAVVHHPPLDQLITPLHEVTEILATATLSSRYVVMRRLALVLDRLHQVYGRATPIILQDLWPSPPSLKVIQKFDQYKTQFANIRLHITLLTPSLESPKWQVRYAALQKLHQLYSEIEQWAGDETLFLLGDVWPEEVPPTEFSHLFGTYRDTSKLGAIARSAQDAMQRLKEPGRCQAAVTALIDCRSRMMRLSPTLGPLIFSMFLPSDRGATSLSLLNAIYDLRNDSSLVHLIEVQRLANDLSLKCLELFNPGEQAVITQLRRCPPLDVAEIGHLFKGAPIFDLINPTNNREQLKGLCDGFRYLEGVLGDEAASVITRWVTLTSNWTGECITLLEQLLKSLTDGDPLPRDPDVSVLVHWFTPEDRTLIRNLNQ